MPEYRNERLCNASVAVADLSRARVLPRAKFGYIANRGLRGYRIAQVVKGDGYANPCAA